MQLLNVCPARPLAPQPEALLGGGKAFPPYAPFLPPKLWGGSLGSPRSSSKTSC